ncbi:hypothetical protein DEJ49_33275 [Streptomyces venezuelae]|uniref:Uncharacterized protein n=1 Tax=Streptomyces venezuelae TaxID=54571 RepID=A0A5P2CS29_STRVZ|nr:hypothetical protein [Streptomyces venezuelae]QES45213.1 hypothetical protein DEJ49_33275 [Streptomyces venezuelae]
MKEPKQHIVIESDFGPDDPICGECGDNWPCRTWRRWTTSKDYRIAELEAAVKRLTDRAGDQERQLHRLEQVVREDSNILRNGIFRAVSDLGRHGRMGDLTLDRTRDDIDITPPGAMWRERTAGPVELTVTYEGLDGRTWVNGHPDG